MGGEIQRNNKLRVVQIMTLAGWGWVYRRRDAVTRYRPESTRLTMTEKEIPFLVKQNKKNSPRPHLLFPVVVFIIQWIP